MDIEAQNNTKLRAPKNDPLPQEYTETLCTAADINPQRVTTQSQLRKNCLPIRNLPQVKGIKASRARSIASVSTVVASPDAQSSCQKRSSQQVNEICMSKVQKRPADKEDSRKGLITQTRSASQRLLLLDTSPCKVMRRTAGSQPLDLQCCGRP